ncbi:MAG: hypothetical protein RLZZ142_2219 [Verrucomicrobiota bacterium]
MERVTHRPDLGILCSLGIPMGERPHEDSHENFPGEKNRPGARGERLMDSHSRQTPFPMAINVALPKAEARRRHRESESG